MSNCPSILIAPMQGFDRRCSLPLRRKLPALLRSIKAEGLAGSNGLPLIPVQSVSRYEEKKALGYFVLLLTRLFQLQGCKVPCKVVRALLFPPYGLVGSLAVLFSREKTTVCHPIRTFQRRMIIMSSELGLHYRNS